MSGGILNHKGDSTEVIVSALKHGMSKLTSLESSSARFEAIALVSFRGF